VLGISPDRSINDLREKIIREARKAGEREKSNLSRTLDYMLFQTLIETDRFSFLIMGRPESLGCYCPVNELLRSGIETLAENYDVVLIDGEAGVEQINRQVMKSVDTVVIVSDISNRGLQTAALIKKVITSHKIESKYQKLGLVLNRVKGQEAQLQPQVEKTGLDLLGYIPEDPFVTQFDLEGKPLLELPPDSPAYRAVCGLWTRIITPNQETPTLYPFAKI
jgi:CO dehydrogenase maturation factor